MADLSARRRSKSSKARADRRSRVRNYRTSKGGSRRSNERNYRITTVIRVDSLPSEAQRRFVDDLEQAIYAASAKYPAVSHYIVKLNGSEVTVGLQIEKVAPENVENIARALLRDSVHSIVSRLDLESEPQLEESELHLV